MKLSARILKRRAEFTLDLDLVIEPGVTVLFGPSGSGKSTLLACLAGLLNPDQGEVVLGEHVLFRSGSVCLPPEARRIGYLPQDLLLFPHLTVRENLDFGLPPAPPPTHLRRREEWIERLALGPLLGRRPGGLSGGEAQRVALVRALLRFPELLLVDEPLSSLDRDLRERALADLRDLKHELPIPILYVTHSASEVLALADRVLILRAGRLVRHGGPELAFDAAASPAGTGEALNFLSGRVEAADPSRRSASVAWSGQTLKLGRLDLAAGSPVTLTVSPHDILICPTPPGPTSARNLLRAKVEDWTESGGEVLLRLGAPEILFASVTPEAREDLGLEPGREVFLLIKSTSLRKV